MCSACGINTHELFRQVDELVTRADAWHGPEGERLLLPQGATPEQIHRAQLEQWGRLAAKRWLCNEAAELLRARGWSRKVVLNLRRWRQPPTHWWEADHRVPVAEGGADLGLENLRTLCRPCHARETSALRRRLNEKKKKA